MLSMFRCPQLSNKFNTAGNELISLLPVHISLHISCHHHLIQLFSGSGWIYSIQRTTPHNSNRIVSQHQLVTQYMPSVPYTKNGSQERDYKDEEREFVVDVFVHSGLYCRGEVDSVD